MSKSTKQCTHPNTVQVGNPGIIETYCSDCGEVVKTVKFNSGLGMLDSHGDVIMHGAFDSR